MKKYNTVTMKEADERGYSHITTPYSEQEEWMLDNTIKDMKGCHYLLVECVGGIAVYRPNDDVNRVQRDEKSGKLFA